MKKIILILGITCLVFRQAIGQTIIEINPYCKADSITKAPIGERVKFKISHVNTFKIDGTIISKPLTIDFGVPALVNQAVQNGFGNVPDLDTLMELETSLAILKISNIAGIDNAKEIKNLEAKILKIKNINALRSNNEKVVKDSLKQKQEEFITNYIALINGFEKMNACVSLEENLFKQLSDSIFIKDTALVKSNCKSLLLSNYSDEDSQVAITELNGFFDAITTSYTYVKLKYEELHNMQKKETLTMQGKIKTENETSTAQVTATIIPDYKKYFEDEYAYAKKTFDQITDVKNKKALIEKAQAGIFLYNKIKAEDFTVTTDVETVTGDEITVTPVLKYANGKVAKEFSHYTIRTTGGIKVNFSSGYLLSFEGDDNYNTYNIDATGTTKGVAIGNKNQLTHALGALTHVYWRFATDYNVSLTTGISLANNESLGFYLGGSLLFLEKNRIAISSGVSYIQLQKLNTSNLIDKGGDKYEFQSQSDTNIKYDEVYRPQWFIGITYNLTTNK